MAEFAFLRMADRTTTLSDLNVKAARRMTVTVSMITLARGPLVLKRRRRDGMLAPIVDWFVYAVEPEKRTGCGCVPLVLLGRG